MGSARPGSRESVRPLSQPTEDPLLELEASGPPLARATELPRLRCAGTFLSRSVAMCQDKSVGMCLSNSAGVFHESNVLRSRNRDAPQCRDRWRDRSVPTFHPSNVILWL